jgi:lysophospholipase L1-like esterase
MRIILFLLCALFAVAESRRVTIWTSSTHGPYPSGNPVAQPDLRGILDAKEGALNQTFRLVIKPSAHGAKMRLRFSNVFGSRPVTLDDAFVGVHASAGAVQRGTNTSVRFRGKTSVTIPPGELVYSDPVTLKKPGARLAVSFHINGASGPMTWHAKAITTSYLTARNGGSHGADESSAAFPFTTTSWFFLDALDAEIRCAMPVIVGFGDSITDGTGSTINGDDRWPDFLAQRLGPAFAVVNAGIGGNRVSTPAPYDKNKPVGGGPSALERLDRDVLQLPGVTHVVWLEGINDLGSGGSNAETVIEGFKAGAAKLRAKGIKVIGATIVSSFKSTPTHGTPEVDAARRKINDFIRNSGGVFDAVVDFDAATIDSSTGALKREFVPSSSVGGPGDGLHPNRAGYQAMANAFDLAVFGKSGCRWQ